MATHTIHVLRGVWTRKSPLKIARSGLKRLVTSIKFNFCSPVLDCGLDLVHTPVLHISDCRLFVPLFIRFITIFTDLIPNIPVGIRTLETRC